MPQMSSNTRWDQVHQCHVCGHAVRLDHINLKIITAGVITCPKCESSGPVNVKIMDEELIPDNRPYSNGNGQ